MKILVTGGAGYIGSFMTKALLDRGDLVTVFDNLERGHLEAVDKRAKFVKGDVKSLPDLTNLFSEKFDAAIHFAGLISVGESEQNPDLYHENNVEGSRHFFETAISQGRINSFIFSSSAAVYGNPIKVPIPEDHPKSPTSEYGKNKLAVEAILTDLAVQNSDVGFVALRYFNAAGGSLDSVLGENHNPETHIIPKILESISQGVSFKLFGNDYETKDGTCVRDYIHVLDLVEAHMLALDKLRGTSGGHFYNVGTGNGYSNKEVIDTVEKITGQIIKIDVSPRRPGDANELIADPTKIKNELNFSPKYSDIETIVKTAWQCYSKK